MVGRARPRPRGLVCDDAATSRRAVEAILARCGFDLVGSVESAGDALVAVELATPDVVVVDLTLTGDLGVRVVTALRAAQPRCAVVVLSPFPSLRQSALEAGAYDFVADSSSDLRELERCLRRLADERGDAVELDGATGAAGGPDQAGGGTPPSPAAPPGSRRTNAPSS